MSNWYFGRSSWLVFLVAGLAFVRAAAAGQAPCDEHQVAPRDGGGSIGFGDAVAIDGGVAVVGARFDDDDGTNSGSAYVFRRNNDGCSSWSQAAGVWPGRS